MLYTTNMTIDLGSLKSFCLLFNKKLDFKDEEESADGKDIFETNYFFVSPCTRDIKILISLAVYKSPSGSANYSHFAAEISCEM
jgi:hypothetical protein